ncbi:MAG: hypothetical protein MZV65_29595 [Chromatiales bacterium]|nr:hypothetical protein [Chromatiales bacterium]
MHGTSSCDWIDARFPLTEAVEDAPAEVLRAEELQLLVLLRRRSPLLVLVIQIVTGIFLTMNYKPDADAGVRVGRVHHARRASGAG